MGVPLRSSIFNGIFNDKPSLDIIGIPPFMESPVCTFSDTVALPLRASPGLEGLAGLGTADKRFTVGKMEDPLKMAPKR